MKLQFEENEYYLMKDGEELAIATTDESFIKELGAERLSLENCEAIKNDYDLEELAINHAEGNDNYITAKNSFKVGAETILEILGDKKFSEEHLKVAADWHYETKGKKSIDEYIQSLQQTEWDVTFNPEEKDANGCLILKRK